MCAIQEQLQLRGMKCGGTLKVPKCTVCAAAHSFWLLQERANRLFQCKGVMLSLLRAQHPNLFVLQKAKKVCCSLLC